MSSNSSKLCQTFTRIKKNMSKKENQQVVKNKAKHIINGYELTSQLGKGAFSIVFKAEKVDIKQIYAMKIIPKSNLKDPGDETRFQREIDSMAYMKHDNIVKMHDFFQDEQHYYIVLDYCQGGELTDFIIKNGKLNEPTAALLFSQIASAVAYCHANGVAHRDLKPENILIDKFPHIKVTDFGLCGYLDEKQLMTTFCGSPSYCSPECITKLQYDGKLSDVWSLGVILYTMVTGYHPWDITNTVVMAGQISRADFQVPKYVSNECKELITSMIRVKADERMTLDKILKHPWLLLAKQANIVQRTKMQVRPPVIPKQQETVLEKTTKARHKSINNQIVSPFDDEGVEREQPTQQSARSQFSKTFTKSMSFETLVRDSSAPSRAMNRTSSVHMQRQRSANNLTARTSSIPRIPK